MWHNTLVVTYCSREKDPSQDLLPARDRYLSARIHAADEAASRLQFGFRILSGIYGLLEPDRMIPAYDHLLTADQVPDHARKTAGQLAESEARRVVFITRSTSVDPGAEPYRQSLQLACEAVGIECGVLEITAEEPSAAALVKKIKTPGEVLF
ncbi:MAG: hypothetical protein ABFS42_06510 [Candidatus Krumholzibacteriota bacterium]